MSNLESHEKDILKREDINQKREKMFDELIFLLDDRLVEFRSVVELMQKEAKDYKGYDLSAELNEHLLSEV